MNISKNKFNNLLTITSLVIAAGFIYGLFKSIIHISANHYLDYKMYNLILFDLVSITTDILIHSFYISIALIVIATISKWVAEIISFNKTITKIMIIVMTISLLIILLIISAYIYYPTIESLLKSHYLIERLKTLSFFKGNPRLFFSYVLAFIIFFFVATISYSKWRKSLDRFLGKLFSGRNSEIIKNMGLFIISIVILFNLTIFGYKKLNTPEGPNVVLISIDTLRADHLGAYGYERNTSPNIDQFAQKAVLYENAISQAPWTLPSMMSMYTSRYPSHAGAKDVYSNIVNELLTLPEFMKNNFYNTIAVISHIVVSEIYGFSQGFNTFNQEHIAQVDEISSEIITNQAVEYISQNKNEKFFLWIHYFDPHHNYKDHSEYAYSDEYSGVLPKNLDNKKLNKINSSLNETDLKYIKDVYDEEISYTDKYIGVLIDSLDELGFMDNTIIVLISDHGEEFMERTRIGHGSSLYRELIHVPLIIYNPLDVGKMGKRVSKHVELRNIPKTITELSGLNENLFQGINLLDDEKLKLDQIVISENYGFQAGSRTEVIIYQNWKLINNNKSQVSELYKIDTDKNETNNLFEINNEEINIQKEKLQSIISMIRNNNEEDFDEAKLSKEDVKQLKALGYIQ